MKSIVYFLFFSLVLTSCSEGKSDQPAKITEEDPKNLSLEEMTDRHVRATLGINPDEKFSLKIYKEHLDGDDKIDAVITVNRLNYALDEAAKSNNSAKQAEVGFTGNFNYIFYYDGHLNQISPDIKIASSPHGELKVSFEHISSEAYKDVLVDYKIRNSSFRDFFTILNHSPILVFQWKIYDRLGEKDPEALYFEYAPGTQSTAKDILIYPGNLDNASSVGDIYKFVPKISKKGELLHRFFYLDAEGKYFTKK